MIFLGGVPYISGSYKVRPAELHRLTLNAPPLGKASRNPYCNGLRKEEKMWLSKSP
jgi:hypothetical protein